jgi:membrane-bound ClpP family serine protease
MSDFLQSGWGTGLFIGAVILNLVLFDRHTIGEWYSISLAAIVLFMVAGMGLHSPLMGTIGLIALIALVLTGVIVKLRERRSNSTDKP